MLMKEVVACVIWGCRGLCYYWSLVLKKEGKSNCLIGQKADMERKKSVLCTYLRTNPLALAARVVGQSYNGNMYRCISASTMRYLGLACLAP